MEEKELLEKADEVTEAALSDAEKEVVNGFQVRLTQQKNALGEMRIQYLKQEARLLEAISQTEESYLENLKSIATDLGLDIQNQGWQFDFQDGVFRRR